MGKGSIQELGVKAKRNQETQEKAQLRGETVLEDIANIKIASPFMDLFPVRQEILGAIIEDMGLNGYDRSKPLDIWAERGVVLDGHTRLVAAKQAGIQTVPTHRHSFKDQDTALEYAVHNQRDRRNLTDAEILHCVEALDRLKPRGGDRKSKKSKAPSGAIDRGKSAELTARKIGTSTRTVERARTVAKSPQQREAVQAGKQTISGAAREIREKKKPPEKAAPRVDYAALFRDLAGIPEKRPAGLRKKDIEWFLEVTRKSNKRLNTWLRY